MNQKFRLFSFWLFLGMLICISFTGFTQNPPPPPGEHGRVGDQPPVGGNAPLGGGLVLLFGMGIGYAIKHFVDLKRQSKD